MGKTEQPLGLTVHCFYQMPLSVSRGALPFNNPFDRIRLFSRQDLPDFYETFFEDW
jgi:hypothetical protein